MATPKIRFKEFDEDWKTVQLGKICTFTQGIQIPSSDQINQYKEGYIRYLYIRDFFTDKFSCYIRNIYPEKIIHPHEIMMVNTGNTTGEAYTGKYGVLSNNSFKIGYDLNLFDNKFMYLFCSSELAQNQIKKFFNAGGQPHLGHKNIAQLLFSYPQKAEQTKIATFLSAVDEKISQLSQKLHLLGQYKQGMMQKLFSQQIRFKADDGSEFGEWESKTLGEVGENIIGLTYSPTDVTNDGSGILVLRSSNIKNGRLDKNDQVRVNKKIKEKIIVQPNDILICTRNGSQRLIGKSVILNDDEVMTFGAFMSVYRSRSNRFIAYLMQTPWFFEQVQMNLGARINQITTGTLNEFTFDFPCFEEQTKIANFLSSIDQKIDDVSEQLEQAKLWKKGLLQQMFV